MEYERWVSSLNFYLGQRGEAEATEQEISAYVELSPFAAAQTIWTARNAILA